MERWYGGIGDWGFTGGECMNIYTRVLGTFAGTRVDPFASPKHTETAKNGLTYLGTGKKHHNLLQWHNVLLHTLPV